MKRARVLLLAACFGIAAAACGKYGPPVRAGQSPPPAQEEPQKDEAKP